MTAAEMKELFLVQYDAASSLSSPGWEDDEISNFLNKSQFNIVTELYKSGDIKFLSSLIVTEAFNFNINPYTFTNSMAYNIDLFNIDGYVFLYYLSSETELTRTNPEITNEYIPNEVIENTNVEKFVKSGLNKVGFKYPKCFFEYNDAGANNVFVMLYDSYTTPSTFGRIRFITKPRDIDITNSIDTNINPVLHQNIVEGAVREALKAVKLTKLSKEE